MNPDALQPTENQEQTPPTEKRTYEPPRVESVQLSREAAESLT
jgi:hypothetical protein